MNIIGETPAAYANIDPLDFDNIFTQLDIDEEEVEILELDRIPPFARYIQHVSSDP